MTARGGTTVAFFLSSLSLISRTQSSFKSAQISLDFRVVNLKIKRDHSLDKENTDWGDQSYREGGR